MNATFAALITIAALTAPGGPHGRTVLKGAAARRVLSQCSRQSPGAAKELWVPQPEQLDILEARLHDRLKAKGFSETPPASMPSTYASTSGWFGRDVVRST